MGRELGKWDKVHGRDSRGCKMIKMINYMFWAKQNDKFVKMLERRAASCGKNPKIRGP